VSLLDTGNVTNRDWESYERTQNASLSASDGTKVFQMEAALGDTRLPPYAQWIAPDMRNVECSVRV